MDLSLWKRISGFIGLDCYPNLPCPYCKKTELQLEKDSLQTKPISQETLLTSSKKYKLEHKNKRNTLKSKQQTLSQSDGFWLPLFDAISVVYQDLTHPLNGEAYLMTAFLTCQSCLKHVSASGVLLKPQNPFDKNKVKSDHIKIEHFSPTIPIFPLSPNIPKPICDELIDAFKHFHFDPPSSASKLRRAIEQFCNEMQVEGSNLNRKVQSLAKFYPEEASYLEPLKLVGNEGTHGSGVEELDLLYSFQIFQFVLELYDRKQRFDALQDTYKKLAEKMGSNKLQLEHKKSLPSAVKQ
ncbi:DUF4145 domain-containing protein [Photobacterium halotolerans]|uniref:DUF4145 domain-containing protein n=1 Tax=Photobacterium halotolerans TaxID=265726 RepID=UPI00137353A4|nr:DUF4145 domain-containing protein [Photobacterium halotolerans]NAX47779.1 DUF4145 domain-containing protein [Photobacterium halotolerans]